MADPTHLDLGDDAGTPAPAVAGGTGRGAPATAGFGYVLDALAIDPSGRGGIVVLRLVGEIDLASSAAAEHALHCGLHADARCLLVDLSGVRFCGVCGFTALAAAARTAASQEIGYAYSGLSPHLDRVATTLWGPDGPTRYRSVAAAVTAIRAAERDAHHR